MSRRTKRANVRKLVKAVTKSKEKDILLPNMPQEAIDYAVKEFSKYGKRKCRL